MAFSRRTYGVRDPFYPNTRHAPQGGHATRFKHKLSPLDLALQSYDQMELTILRDIV